MRVRKTDYGTIILHWLLVGATVVDFTTGLRMATEAPSHAWISEHLDWALPRQHTWTWHMPAGVMLASVAIAYMIYIAKSGLGRRVAVDKMRIKGLMGRRPARLGSISVFLHWVLFITMAALIVTGGLLFFGIESGYVTMMIHWYATWVVPAFILLHILVHYGIGGASQLYRVFRPQALPPPPPRLDPVELLTMLVEQSERLEESEAPIKVSPAAPAMRSAREQMPASRSEDLVRGRVDARNGAVRPRSAAPPTSGGRGNVKGNTKGNARRRNPTFQANPFVVAAAVAIFAGWAMVAADYYAEDTVTVHRIENADAPTLDGDTSDRVWRNIQPHMVTTNQGDNFDGTGESKVWIKAAHDDSWVYFLVIWEDPTRSLKQLPLIKRADGWHLLHNGYEKGDENDYNEDKFSLLFTTLPITLAADRTFHMSSQPMPDKPATLSGRGIHYTPAPNLYADAWEWKATSGGPTGWMDDDHFGPPAEPTPEQVKGLAPYKGGFGADPGNANYSDNFVIDRDAEMLGNRGVRPKRLPKDVTAMKATMGEINLDPNIGESDGARWFMTEAESVPYTMEADAQIPVGTVVPGVIINGDFSGDRADIRCAARWASGHWTLEIARKMDTHSKYDVPIKNGVFMRVAAFDHTQIRHTRQIRPMRLEVE
ncbi:ethylbenzene dehydrogenase-related protein [Bradyrhizobium sp. SZCCHNPS2010]|uniref:ethylbenzene dehydrogenase-related protein n=1 Tax=Bradyrhizobium sp. SZCCHNPS2010 TaxID=3057333 RepID=UPI00291654D4|nr:ethylbenzene dehydrogenase-related protein [Bradyrhizobium sp. SZCCHNPS2010]